MTEQVGEEVMEKTVEEPKPGISKKRMIEESSSSEEEVEEIDPSLITDELLQKYASEMPSELPMTISEELFYSDAMVQREYDRLSKEDKKRFDQMKVLAEKIKKEIGQYVPIEDMMAWVVAQRFSRMTQQNVAMVLGPSGKGPAAGKHLEGRVVARSPLEIQFVSELNKNSGPYGTTNSSQRKYKLKNELLL